MQSTTVNNALYSPLSPAPSAVSPRSAGTGSVPTSIAPAAPVQAPGKSAFLAPSQASETALYNQFAKALISPQSVSSVQEIANSGLDPAAGNDVRRSGQVNIQENNKEAVVAASGVYNAADDSGQDRSEAAGKPEPASYSQQQDSENRQSEGIASATGAGEAYTALDERQLQEVRKLAAIDREVRAHEQAHVAVGGQHAGAPQYSYKKGPDGIDYAVAGEVPIDVSVVPGKPEATIAKMEQVRRAALAPAQPSSQDRAVAAQAMQTLLQARSEMAQEQSQSGPSQAMPNQGGVSEQTDAGRDNTDLANDGNSFLKRGLQTYAELASMANNAISGSDTTYVLDEVV